MKRLVLALAAAAVAFVAFAPKASAHGGQFRGPGGAVPPGLREPSDPTPPPPPPPTTQPPTTPPSDPGVPPPAPTTPSTGTAPPPPPTTGDPTNPQQGKKSPTSFDQWVFWWNNNNDDILHLKESIYRLKATRGTPWGDVEGNAGNRTDATRATEKQVKELVIPALLWAIDHENKQHPDTESAAYIALAKVTDQPEHAKLLMNGVYGADGKPNKVVDQIVNESAALSLGLLRRSEKDKQFDAKMLDDVRDFCFAAFEDDGLATRTRAFAMLSIGLLGDQPSLRKAGGPTFAPNGAPTTGGGVLYAPDPAATAPTTSMRIYDLLRRSYKDVNLPVALLLALGMQDPTEVAKNPEILETLRDCALKGRLFKEEQANDIVPSYAALALGRVGNQDYVMPMLNAMKTKQTGVNVKRSAAIALGQLGRRIDGTARADLAVQLWKAIEDVSDASAKNFGVISLAYLLEADIEAKRTDVLNAKGVKLGEELVKLTGSEGKFSQRPYGALALGLIGAKIGDRPDIKEYAQLRSDSLKVLREGLEDKKLDKRSRAAFAVGLGILHDSDSKKKLVDVVGDKSEDKEFRGYAAVALGMISEPSKEIEEAILSAMHEHSSEELRSQTAVALGLLQSRRAVDELLKEMDAAETQNVKGQIVVALAKIGDARTIKPLVDNMKKEGPYLTRALSCAGLGLIGDLEAIPSLARISKDINYRAAVDCINEVLSIL
jgi:HEAT repeat protein